MMKKSVIILITLLFVSIALIAQSTSTLIMFSESGIPFDLYLNGVKQNTKPISNIRVEGLTQPYYMTKITFSDSNITPIEKKNLIVQDMDGMHAEATYIIKTGKKGSFKIKLYSAIPLKDAPPAKEDANIVVYTSTPRSILDTSISITETTTTTTTNNPVGSDNISLDVDMGGINIDMDVNVNTSDMEIEESTTTTTTTTTTTIGGGFDNTNTEINDPTSCYTSMSEFDFDDAKSSIANKTFEDSKLTLAKQVADSNCLLSKQVKEIIQLFDHESTRLEFAKYAYPRVYDKNAYYKVNDGFQFESSIDELNEFIK